MRIVIVAIALALLSSAQAQTTGASAPTRAEVKSDTAGTNRTGTAPVDQYDASPRTPARAGSAPRFHLPHRHHKTAAAASSASN